MTERDWFRCAVAMPGYTTVLHAVPSGSQIMSGYSGVRREVLVLITQIY
jgi:hypothetical protein